MTTMSHRFRMPPGGSARDCWENPTGCSRIAPAIIESKEAIERYVRLRDIQRANPLSRPTAAKGGFPYYA